MPNIGDIVKYTQDALDTLLRPGSGHMIVLTSAQAASAAGTVRFGTQHLLLNENGVVSISTHSHWLELVHELSSPQARTTHESFPRHSGHSYFWYCQERDITPCYAPAELEHVDTDFLDVGEGVDVFAEALAEGQARVAARAFQIGDLVRVHGVGGMDLSREPWDGREGVITELNVANSGNHCIRKYNGVCENWGLQNLQLVATAPEAVAPVAPLPWDQWLPGDIVRRTTRTSGYEPNSTMEAGEEFVLVNTLSGNCINVRRLGEVSGQVGSESGWDTYGFTWVSRPVATVIPRLFQVGDLVRVVGSDYPEYNGTEGVITRAAGYGSLCLRTDSGQEQDWSAHRLELVSAAAPAAILPDGLPSPRSIGARVLINQPGYSWHGRAGSVAGESGFSGSYRIWIDGHSSYQLFRPANLLPLVAEPQMPAYAPTGGECWLDLEGAAKEDIDSFLEALSLLGVISECNKFNGFGSSAEGPLNGADGKRVGLKIGRNVAYYYHRGTDVIVGSLLRDWNAVLTHYKRLKQPTTAVANQRLLGLTQLPDHFIVEQQETGTQTPEQSSSHLLAHGFRGYTGTYTLFFHNHAVGTSFKGAAEAFARKHGCPWLNTEQDTLAISQLFRTRKAMIATTAAKEKFSVDTLASGPHLIGAFKAMLSASGFRQENAALADGPYILLNGGNLHADQQGTWQYSATKNNRNALINLAEPSPAIAGDLSTMSGKSGWEKACERLANRNTGLPVLDAGNLERPLIAGDKVCLVDNSLNADYPETDADLRAHTCGQCYTVRRLVGGLCMMSDTGLLLHPDRLQLLETPIGVQNGDQVQLIANYGELLKEGEVLTWHNGGLLHANGASYAVPATLYTPASSDMLVNSLLRKAGITLPCVVKVTAADMAHEEVILTTAWAINNQELAYWTEDTPEKESWLERKDFQVVSRRETAVGNVSVFKGLTRETTTFSVTGNVTLAELEEALAA